MRVIAIALLVIGLAGCASYESAPAQLVQVCDAAAPPTKTFYTRDHGMSTQELSDAVVEAGWTNIRINGRYSTYVTADCHKSSEWVNNNG